MAAPIKKFRAVQVSCALWENEATINGKSVTMLRATVERRYKDKNGDWKSSQSFGRNEIPLVKWCLDQAFTAIIQEGTTSNDSEKEEVIQ